MKLKKIRLEDVKAYLKQRKVRREEVIENFPEAKIVFSDPNSISSGWRTHERYFSMRGMFKNNKYDPDFIKN